MAVFKLTMLLTRRADLTAEAFGEAWLELERRQPISAAGLERYVVDVALPTTAAVPGAAPAPYDAVVESWWTRKNDAADWFVSRTFDREWMPPRRELLAEIPAAIVGEPVVLWETQAAVDDEPVTVITLPIARRGLGRAVFTEHWVGAHAELALAGPGAKERLVRLEDTPAPLAPPTRFTRTNCDGVGAITFRSLAALADEFSSAHYREQLVPDEARFTNTEASSVFVGTPVVLLP